MNETGLVRGGIWLNDWGVGLYKLKELWINLKSNSKLYKTTGRIKFRKKLKHPKALQLLIIFSLTATEDDETNENSRLRRLLLVSLLWTLSSHHQPELIWRPALQMKIYCRNFPFLCAPSDLGRWCRRVFRRGNHETRDVGGLSLCDSNYNAIF